MIRGEPGASVRVAALAAFAVLGTLAVIVGALFTAAAFLVWLV